MGEKTKTEKLLLENKKLRERLAETEEALNAIRHGEVDAIVVSSDEGEKIFTLTSAETPYRIILEEMEEGAATIAEDGTILYCNRRLSELMCIASEQIVGSNFSRFMEESEKQKYLNLMKKGLYGRSKGDLTYITPSCQRLYLHLSFRALPMGMQGKICIIVTDITELKKHQLHLEDLVNERTVDLERINVQLKETNASKDKLFSIIAHDLKNPFTSLLGFSDLLLENIRAYDTEKLRLIISHINSAAKSAYNLLENLLVWARSQNGQLRFTPRLVPFFKLVKEVTDGLNSLAVMKNINITYSPSRDNLMVLADENMLTTILRNLITNAIKFSNDGGTIEIYATSDTHQALITVADNGIGMKPETKTNLFRIDSSTSLAGTAHEKGTGLGLILCYDLIERHGGNIWVDSELNKGSKFTFTLPFTGLEIQRSEIQGQEERRGREPGGIEIINS